MSGTTAKNSAEVKMATAEGLYLVVEGKGYFAAFADFPYLADLPASQVFNVEYCGHGHIRWDDADIDLHTKILAQPENYPLRMQTAAATTAPFKRGGCSMKRVCKAVSSSTKVPKARNPRPKKPVLA